MLFAVHSPDTRTATSYISRVKCARCKKYFIFSYKYGNIVIMDDATVKIKAKIGFGLRESTLL
jgi:hypothetical protein